VLLTTQYLDEADQLADSIVVVEAGRHVAGGTPEELKAQVGGDRLEVIVADAADLGAARDAVGRVASALVDVDEEGRRVSAPVAHRVAALAEVIPALDAAGVAVDDIGLRRPTLDDVFLHLTGHRTVPSGPTDPTDPSGPTGTDAPTDRTTQEVAA
jgi:ABC-2 type transport system ATP-binding protein